MSDAKQSTVHELEVHGVKFTVDTDLLDDVKTLEYFDRIEGKGHVSAVMPLLVLVMGEKGYKKLEADFTKADADEHAKEYPDPEVYAKEHPEAPEYHPRMRVQHLQDTYLAIVDKFNPKALR
jgi:hypothetical protein